ncbi:MAG TPA: hypothetical protein VN999_00525 [Thermoanaerobaculia bacterium]|nr:hypothetical protein [Thermoanaerobaculia bacterium]
MTRHVRWWILTAIAAASALGCGVHQRSPSEPAVQPDSIVIDSISPPAGTTLAPGSTVVFGAILHYAAHENLGGGVAAQMEDASGNLLVTRFPATAVPQGAGMVTLASQFQIPSSGLSRIDIYYILYATPGVTTEIVASTKASYPVGR